LLAERVPPQALATVRRMIDRRINCPLTSSAGRVFDGVAALAGIRERVSFEGQAAMELEWLAGRFPEQTLPRSILMITDDAQSHSPLVIDLRPMFVELAAELERPCEQAIIARRFHSTLVEVINQVCERLRRRTGLEAVVLSGGVLQNVLLTTEVTARLEGEGFLVYRHRRVPPGDGGLCWASSPWRRRLAGRVPMLDYHSTSRPIASAFTDEDSLMCLAIPGKVVETYREHDRTDGNVDFGGSRSASAWSTSRKP